MGNHSSEKSSNSGFSLKDVQEVLAARAASENMPSKEVLEEAISPEKMVTVSKPKAAPNPEKVLKSAVSIADILGFDPQGKTDPVSVSYDIEKVDPQYRKYFTRLMKMKEDLQDRLRLRTQETKKSQESDQTERARALGVHTADSASESADLELALSFVENEKDLLTEVEDALQRLMDGTYGVCEQTGKPIDKKRLDVLPFTRFSLEGKQAKEKEEIKINPVISEDILGFGAPEDEAEEETSATEN